MPLNDETYLVCEQLSIRIAQSLRGLPCNNVNNLIKGLHKVWVLMWNFERKAVAILFEFGVGGGRHNLRRFGRVKENKDTNFFDP